MIHLARSMAMAAKDDAMSLDEGRHTQRPYRYGMVLLCAGALINWLGLAEDYAEPVRYVGVACIVAGALLICAAMCCWLQAPHRQPQDNANVNGTANTHQIDDPIHVINVPSDEEIMQQKPPDYETVAGAPPTYDDAIKLNPAQLLVATQPSGSRSQEHGRISSGSQTCPSVVVSISDTIPGQMPSGEAPSAVQTPKTPPPPYQPVRTIR